jgi:hypothetical protein
VEKHPTGDWNQLFLCGETPAKAHVIGTFLIHFVASECAMYMYIIIVNLI